MKANPQPIRLYGDRTLSIEEIAEYRLMEGRLKVTVKTPDGEYSVYLDEGLAEEGYASLRSAFPAGEKRALSP